MPLRTLQIAVLGGNEDAVLVGLRNFPAHKLSLVSLKDNIEKANQMAANLHDTLKLAVDVVPIKDATIPTMLETIGQVFGKESENFEDFLINVGSASKQLTCAAVTAAFVHGIKGFDVMGEQPVLLPVMKLSYSEVVSEAKLEILRAIEKAGGEVESLEKLSKLSDYGKPLLSYHIRGSEDSRGLLDLGLVDVERVKRGRIKVKLTSLGRMLVSTASARQTAG